MEQSTAHDLQARPTRYVALVRQVQQAMDAVAERFPALGARRASPTSVRDLERINEELRGTVSPAVEDAFTAWVHGVEAVDGAVAGFNEFRDNHHADGPNAREAYTAELTRRIDVLRGRRDDLDRLAERLVEAITDELEARGA